MNKRGRWSRPKRSKPNEFRPRGRGTHGLKQIRTGDRFIPNGLPYVLGWANRMDQGLSCKRVTGHLKTGEEGAGPKAIQCLGKIDSWE